MALTKRFKAMQGLVEPGKAYPVEAALKILKGEEVPKQWNLPQPKVTSENLSTYLQPNMPPLHYALCGCEDLPGFPENWGGKKG